MSDSSWHLQRYMRMNHSEGHVLDVQFLNGFYYAVCWLLFPLAGDPQYWAVWCLSYSNTEINKWRIDHWWCNDNKWSVNSVLAVSPSLWHPWSFSAAFWFDKVLKHCLMVSVHVSFFKGHWGKMLSMCCLGFYSDFMPNIYTFIAELLLFFISHIKHSHTMLSQWSDIFI